MALLNYTNDGRTVDIADSLIAKYQPQAQAGDTSIFNSLKGDLINSYRTKYANAGAGADGDVVYNNISQDERNLLSTLDQAQSSASPTGQFLLKALGGNVDTSSLLAKPPTGGTTAPVQAQAYVPAQKMIDLGNGQQVDYNSATPTIRAAADAGTYKIVNTQAQGDPSTATVAPINQGYQDRLAAMGGVGADPNILRQQRLAGQPLTGLQTPQNALGATQGQATPQGALAQAGQIQASLGEIGQKYGMNTQLPEGVDLNAPTTQQGQTTSATVGGTTNGTAPLIDTNRPLKDIVKEMTDAFPSETNTALSKEIQAIDDKYSQDVHDINDNPWYSDALRSKKIGLLDAKYETRKNALMEQLRDERKFQSDLVSKAVDVYYKEKEIQQETLKMQLAQRQNEIENQLAEMKISNDYGTGAIGEYNFAKTQGYTGSFTQYQNEDANRKARATAGANGLTPSQINTTVNQIAGSFDNEQVVKDFSTLQTANNFVQGMSGSTTNPVDDQGLVYALAKALDPSSAVREGEYNTAQKYAQSMVAAYGKSVTQALNGTGFLSADARANIKKTIQSKFEAAQQSYNQVYNQYQQRIQAAQSGQGNTLTDYRVTNTPAVNPSKSIVEKALNSMGTSYDQALANVPKGRIGVVDKATGQIGSVLPNEFNDSLYVKL